MELIFRDFSCVLIFRHFEREIQISKNQDHILDVLKPQNMFSEDIGIRETNFTTSDLISGDRGT